MATLSGLSSKAWLLIGVILIGGFAGITGLTWLHYHNREVGLRNQIAASQTALKSDFDAMWKIISQKAQIAEQYKDGFKDIYSDLISGRYKDGKQDALLRFIQESNPQFDITLYASLSRSVEAQRTKFADRQRQLLDLKREHDDLLTKGVSSMFVGGRPHIDVTIVTSEKTEDVFNTGQDNDVDIFGRDKNKKPVAPPAAKAPAPGGAVEKK